MKTRVRVISGNKVATGQAKFKQPIPRCKGVGIYNNRRFRMPYGQGVRGGHAGGHLTESIIEALDDLQSGRIKKWYDAFNSHKEARMTAGKLWHCTDILGSHLRSIAQDEFHLEKELFTYAQLSRVLLNDMNAVSA